MGGLQTTYNKSGALAGESENKSPASLILICVLTHARGKTAARKQRTDLTQ